MTILATAGSKLWGCQWGWYRGGREGGPSRAWCKDNRQFWGIPLLGPFAQGPSTSGSARAGSRRAWERQAQPKTDSANRASVWTGWWSCRHGWDQLWWGSWLDSSSAARVTHCTSAWNGWTYQSQKASAQKASKRYVYWFTGLFILFE